MIVCFFLYCFFQSFPGEKIVMYSPGFYIINNSSFLIEKPERLG